MRSATRPVPTRDQLMQRLQEHGKISEQDIERIKHAAITASYFNRDDHTGGAMILGQEYTLANGRPFGWSQVPMSQVFLTIEDHIKKNIAIDKQAEVYLEVFDGVPQYKNKPKPYWNPPPPNPNADPLTVFSVPRGSQRRLKSNAQVIHDMVVAGEITKEEKSICANITWWDGSASSTNLCSMRTGEWTIRGGRLGRDHTLDDVPNNYVRDRCMDYTTNFMGSEKRGAARRAAFPDLTDAEIEEYAAAVEKDRLDKELARQEKDRKWSEENDPFYHLSKEDRMKVFWVVSPSDHVKRNHVDSIVKLARALDSVDDTVDQTPHPYCHRRTKYGPHDTSVIKPQANFQLGCERRFGESDAKMIDRDCDQVRALIKGFLVSGEWSLEHFRLALPYGPTRALMTSFLSGRGPCKAKETQLYESCWEFFHRREQLGLPMVGGNIWEDAELVRKKWMGRSSDDEDDAPQPKRVKTK